MTAGALHHLSGVEVLGRFRRRELSPVEYLDALIDRIESLEPTVNAVCDRRFTEARAEARRAADRYAAGEPLGALDGLAVAVKEEHPMLGREWCQGSLVHRGEVAPVDHPVVERIQRAGGVVHVRTTTPEFCCAGFTHSAVWGITRNPWNLATSPGGSSGGSGAALAAGYGPLATGSDIGGSIRIPASFSGVVGFKAPFGRVPALPPFNLDQYCHDGAMARTVADCALLHNVIAGRHPLDAASLPDPPRLPLVGGSVAGLRVALCIHLGDYPVDPDVQAATRAAAALLADAGVEVDEVELPWRRAEVFAAAQTHFAAIFGEAVGVDLAAHPDLLTPYARRFAEMSQAAPLSFLDGMELEGRLWEPLGQLFERYDAVVCPTMGTTAYPAGADFTEQPLVVDGVELEHYLLGALTLPFNMFSRCPVLSVPSGTASNGVPTGVQIVGRTYDDLTVFQLGYAVEVARGGFLPAPL